MKVSQKTEYGLRAMVAIALMGGPDRPVPLSAVADAEAIPEQFLDQIVMRLRKAGFLKSVRGVNGGYFVAKPPEEISIGALVRLLEGSLAPIGCISEAHAPNEFCGRATGCHTRPVWLRVMSAITEALDSISLADVMKDDVPVTQVLG